MSKDETTITINNKPDFDGLTPDELLTCYDMNREQIDTIRNMWEFLSREQTTILTLYHNIKAGDES